MPDGTDTEPGHDVSKKLSRRTLIKGVIFSGVAVSSANYLFRASVSGQGSPAALGERLITLNVNGQQRRVDAVRQETLAWTLRYVRDRNVWDFPLLNVASAMVLSADSIEQIRIAVNAAAARPLRLKSVEDAVRGKPRSQETGEMAASWRCNERSRSNSMPTRFL